MKNLKKSLGKLFTLVSLLCMIDGYAHIPENVGNENTIPNKTATKEAAVFSYPVDPCANLAEYLPNFGFEEGVIPQIRGQFQTHVFDWFTAAGDPDVFDGDFTQCVPSPAPPNTPPCGLSPLDANCIGIPCNHFGSQDQHTPNGRRYAGLYAAVGSNITSNQGVDGRLLSEAVEVELFTALTPGKSYSLSFYVNKAEKGEVDMFTSSIAAFKVKMSVTDKYSGGVVAGQIPFTPVPADLIYEGYVEDTLNWKQIQINIKPNKAYKFLIIESAFNANVILTELSCDVKVVPGANPPVGSEIRYGCTAPYFYSYSVQDLANDNLDSLITKISAYSIDDWSLQSYMYLDDVSLTEACYTDSIVIADAGADLYDCQSPINIIGGTPTATGGTAPYSYVWTKLSPSGGSLYLNNASIANPIAAPPTTTTYRVTVIDANGFSDVDDVTVFVYSDLVADAGNDAGLCDSNCFILGGAPTASGGSGNYSYNWAPSTDLDNASIANPKACIAAGMSRNYLLTVTDITSGCQTFDNVRVTHYSGSPNNMVYNGNFDNGPTPTERDQINYASNWQRATGSPDLFDRNSLCGLTCTPFNNVGIPNNHFGNQSHRLNTNEKRYAGLWSFSSRSIRAFSAFYITLIKAIINISCTAWPVSSPHCPLSDIFDLVISSGVNDVPFLTEGIETKLNTPMIIGNDYQVTAYASIADQGEFSQLASQVPFTDEVDLLVKFSETFASNPNYNAVNADVKKTTKITQSVTWQKVQFTFTANKAYEYIILEAGRLYNGDESYIFIDDVEVIAMCDQKGSTRSLLANKDKVNETSNIVVYPNPASNEINIDLGEYIETPIQVSLMDVTGKVVYEATFESTASINLNTSDFENGTYFITVSANDTQTVDRLIISK